MSVVFYVSGHGFGHASRTIEIINAVGRAAPSLPLHVRSAVSPWLYERTVQVPVEHHSVEVDTGMVQLDSLRLDVEASLVSAAAFYKTLDARAVQEARELRLARAQLVVADIPPLAFEAAAQAGVPALGVGNFTWDWIYEACEGQTQRAPGVPERIRRAHARADGACRLPMHGGFGGFRAVEDVPMVARHATRDPDEVRRSLGLPLDRGLVLVSFGGYGLGWQSVRPLESQRHHLVLTAGTDADIVRTRTQLGRHASVVDERLMHHLGIRYEDLVRASDVVASKPGYGIISECVANERPLLYTDRGAFIEYHTLVAAMPRWLRTRYISNERVFEGQWDDEIDALLSQPPPPERISTRGADLVAQRILQGLGRTGGG